MASRPARRSTSAAPIGWIGLLVLFAITVLLIWVFNAPKAIDYSDLWKLVEDGKVLKVTFIGANRLEGELKSEPDDAVKAIGLSRRHFQADLIASNNGELTKALQKSGVKISTRDDPTAWLGPLMANLLPVLLILAVLAFLVLPRMRDPMGGGFVNNYTKSPARRFDKSKAKTTFEDVADMESAKSELREVVEFLRTPEKFRKLGADVPKGVLLVGPPGTGKTLMARAVAGEADVPFYSINGAEFIQLFVGVGASRVRDLFKTAKENAPCVTGDASVTLSGGRQVTIREMFDRRMVGVRVPAMTADYRMAEATVFAITRKPCPDLFEIATPCGTVQATGNHLFPVLREHGLEWVRADRLSVGDCVAAPRRIATTVELPRWEEFLPDDVKVRFVGEPLGRRRPRIGDLPGGLEPRRDEVACLSIGPGGFCSSYLERFPSQLTEEIAYLCGLLFADGTLGEKGERSLSFVNTESALHERMRTVLQTEFGYRATTSLRPKYYDRLLPQGTYPKHLKDCFVTSIHNKLLCLSLRAVCDRVLELPLPLVAAWLRGVFDGDGCVRSNRRSPQVIVSAWSADANRTIRDALLRVGIPTSRSNRARSDADGNIVVTGLENLKIFVTEVGSHHPVKREKLALVEAGLRDRTTSSSRHDGIPAGPLLLAARRSVGMGQREFRRGNYVSTWERGVVVPSRTSLQGAVAEIEAWCVASGKTVTPELAHLKALAHSDVIWSKIERIERLAPVDYVYDLCLDRHHCFVANDLIVHNCLVFIDEIDAVGRIRGAGLGGGSDEREQTLNQILGEMDGFTPTDLVIVIAATNRPDVLDPALLRPGRFDRHITVDRQSWQGRLAVLKVHTRNKPLAPDVDLEAIAKMMIGMTGADLRNLCNEAALLAARENKTKIERVDFARAADRVLIGPKREEVLNDEDRRHTAYHEAGHALVTWLMPRADRPLRVSIVPRGRALGVNIFVPEEDRYNHGADYFHTRLVTLLGGRAADRLAFGQPYAGAEDDLSKATKLARYMVTHWGMSEKIGPVSYRIGEEHVFLGKEIQESRDFGEGTMQAIDEEVQRLLRAADTLALELLQKNRTALDRIVQELLKREELSREELEQILATYELVKPETVTLH